MLFSNSATIELGETVRDEIVTSSVLKLQGGLNTLPGSVFQGKGRMELRGAPTPPGTVRYNVSGVCTGSVTLLIARPARFTNTLAVNTMGGSAILVLDPEAAGFALWGDGLRSVGSDIELNYAGLQVPSLTSTSSSFGSIALHDLKINNNGGSIDLSDVVARSVKFDSYGKASLILRRVEATTVTNTGILSAWNSPRLANTLTNSVQETSSTGAGAPSVIIKGHTTTQLRLDACAGGAGQRRLLAEEGVAWELRVEAWPEGVEAWPVRAEAWPEFELWKPATTVVSVQVQGAAIECDNAGSTGGIKTFDLSSSIMRYHEDTGACTITAALVLSGASSHIQGSIIDGAISNLTLAGGLSFSTTAPTDASLTIENAQVLSLGPITLKDATSLDITRGSFTALPSSSINLKGVLTRPVDETQALYVSSNSFLSAYGEIVLQAVFVKSRAVDISGNASQAGVSYSGALTKAFVSFWVKRYS
ncbi:hypothetical protein T484DRAFT_1912875 [Baffinella frigidus]|nr:hypothetical protein T484DRAFT_1912875 [Cryptophyta sp. CCMP2293]